MASLAVPDRNLLPPQLLAAPAPDQLPSTQQGFDKGIKQHFEKCTGAPKRRRKSPDADVGGDVVGDEDEGVEDDEDEGGQDVRSVRKLVSGVQGVTQLQGQCYRPQLPAMQCGGHPGHKIL